MGVYGSVWEIKGVYARLCENKDLKDGKMCDVGLHQLHCSLHRAALTRFARRETKPTDAVATRSLILLKCRRNSTKTHETAATFYGFL